MDKIGKYTDLQRAPFVLTGITRVPFQQASNAWVLDGQRIIHIQYWHIYATPTTGSLCPASPYDEF